jgi:ankyrin repeat protein
MSMRCVLGTCFAVLLSAASVLGAPPANSLADAAMNGNKQAVRALLQQKANVNATQIDGTTALHWAARADDLETADLLIKAGANVSAANHDGATPLLLATINGSSAMIEKLVKAGADPNVPVTKDGDTALMMAARTGNTDAVKMLLSHGAKINTAENWGGTTALMWAVSEGHPDVVKVLVDAGADVNARSKFVGADHGRGFEGTTPSDPKPGLKPEEFAGGLMTPLMFAAREGDLDSARILVAAKADVNAADGDGKDALGLAVFNGNYDLASFLIDNHADVNHADAQRFTPLFWAVDHRNNDTPPNLPWVVTQDPLPLIQKMLDAGANPNALVNNTPRSRMREGSPRIVHATAMTRAAFSGDLTLVKLLLAHGGDPHIVSSDRETTLMAACGTGFIAGYHKSRPPAERLEVVKLLVSLGEDVNAADSYGITPLMVAANFGDVPIIQFLVDKGANLGAYDLGKKNDGAFGASVEPLMPVDYAIGVGTFLPNNAVHINEDAMNLMTKMMADRGIKHTTSECTLRGFTCSTANVDPKTATPAEIQKMRKIQIGYQVDGVTGGLAVKDKDKDDKSKDAAPAAGAAAPAAGAAPAAPAQAKPKQ